MYVTSRSDCYTHRALLVERYVKLHFFLFWIFFAICRLHHARIIAYLVITFFLTFAIFHIRNNYRLPNHQNQAVIVCDSYCKQLHQNVRMRSKSQSLQTYCLFFSRTKAPRVPMEANMETKVLWLHHQGKFQDNYCTNVLVYDGDHHGTVRIFVGLSWELYY